MRISERLTRLEQAKNTNPRMSESEIKAAADEFLKGIDRLVARSAHFNIDPEAAIEAWNALVAQPGYLQRVFAGMEPEDMFL
jgi:hypothetical protein